MSKLLKTIKVSGDHEPYLQIDTVEGLIAVAQAAALDCIHGTASLTRLKYPDDWFSISIPYPMWILGLLLKARASSASASACSG